MSRLARVSVLVTLVLAAACAGSEAAQAGGSGTTAVAPAVASARPALPAVIDSITAESLAVDSALRGLTGDPDHAIFGCFVLDTAVYADTRLDTFGDTIGVRITLVRVGGSIDGFRTDVGEPTPPLPLSAARLFGRDSIMLEFPATMEPGETSRFVGRVSCDKLWGRQRNYRDAPTRPVSYARVRDAY